MHVIGDKHVTLDRNAVCSTHRYIILMYKRCTSDFFFLVNITGYQPASHFLEKKIVTYPHLCDPDYVVDLKKDWIGIDDFRPIALP